MEILGYTKWVNFLNVIDKAKIACKNGDSSVSDHFADVGKMVSRKTIAIFFVLEHFRHVAKMVYTPVLKWAIIFLQGLET